MVGEGAPGHGVLRGALINADQLVMEGIGVTKRGYQFHVECFAVWDAERDVLGRDMRTDV